MSGPQSNIVKRSYRATLEDMQQELKPHERRWSQLIHSSLVAWLLAAISRTILRPRPLLVGTWLAVASLATVYILEHLHGYTGSNTEPLLGFVAGWCMGLCYSVGLELKQRFRIKQ